jgi:hypothetical protein
LEEGDKEKKKEDKPPAEKSNVQLRQTVRSDSKRYNAHLEHEANNHTDKAISFINNNNFGWKADVCKLQTHHHEYGSHCDA